MLAAGTLAGCGCTSLIERDTPVARSIERRVDELSRTGPDGATRRLDELTGFAWDRVYFFTGEVTSYDQINAAVGDEVFEGCSSTGYSFSHEDYLIFTRRGKVVHAVGVLTTRIAGEKQSYPRTAVIRTAMRAPGLYLVEVVDNRR